MNRRATFGVIVTGLLLLLSAAVAQSNLTASRQTAITRAIQEISPAVAGINVTAVQQYMTRSFFNDPLWNMLFPDQTYRRRVKSLGSGVVISPDGYIVTNAHVVEGAEEIVVSLAGRQEFDATIVGIDQVSDIALLKIKGEQLPAARLGDSDQIIIGEWVIALGNPFGLFSLSHQPTATAGIVSALDLDFGRQESGRVYQDMIQTDASINTGNSGGPLVNANGEVIGINTFIFTGGYSDGSIGIGFAIPINRVKEIVAELQQHGKIDRGFKTGLSVQNIDRFLAQYLNLPTTRGVIVTEVKRKSAAERADLKVGDVITKVNNIEIHSDSDILRVIQENYLKAGDRITLELYRGKKVITTTLDLE